MRISGSALSGRAALITGSSRGIGREVALRFAREGAELIVVGRSRESLADVHRAICAIGGHAFPAVADLTRPEVVAEVADAVHQRWGRLDLLVGNAGAHGPTSALVDIGPDAWDEVITVNLTANWRLFAELPSALASVGRRAGRFSSPPAPRVNAPTGVPAPAQIGPRWDGPRYAQEVAEPTCAPT